MKFFGKKSHNAEKIERGSLWDFSTSIQSENIKKLKGDPLVKFFFEKKFHRAENTLREYPLAPLSFLDDIKILLRKLSKNCKNCKIVRIVRIVRKVDHSESAEKTTQCNSRIFFLKEKAPTKNDILFQMETHCLI